ncbi:hypothetical protein HZH66_008766 [Vespula vulgaris]|uniref:Uncharacterized protein n=1 Tax=Vespula vulgaris TaxID=7454 RepID=A0A834JQG7_VESVU|nr:hypothetical protein HZH66_008766 [Vespula vulgaris]
MTFWLALSAFKSSTRKDISLLEDSCSFDVKSFDGEATGRETRRGSRVPTGGGGGNGGASGGAGGGGGYIRASAMD